MEAVKIITYIYIGIIFIFILYLGGSITKEKIEEKAEEKKKRKYKEEIEQELKRIIQKKKVSEEHLLFLQKELRNTKNLLIFEDSLTELKEKHALTVEKYCIQISAIFGTLIPIYKQKNSIQKAYFMHVLFVFPEIMQNDDNTINYAMMHFVFDKSIYCRENAMLFFYQKGSAKQVFNSLKKISKRNLYYSPKLLADDLLSFTGKKEELTSLLLAEFNEFSENFQVAITNYIRFSGEIRNEEMYQKLTSRKYPKEVELAIIRYFAKNKYDKVLETLLEMMRNKELYSYEYQIIAAFALQTYDTKEVRDVLMKSLSNENFYVRKNAAISLVNMNVTVNEFKNAANTKDAYAKEMLEYVWEEKLLGSKAKKEKEKGAYQR